MAKKSAVQKNLMRQGLADKYAARRAQLKKTSRDMTLTPEERFKAVVKLSELPRNSNQNRVRLRCELSGRPRGNYRKFKLSRIALRELGSEGLIPGLKKASW